MKAAASDLGKRALAAVILIVAAYILFKVVIGIVAGILWILLVIVALFALVWAARILW
jgi:hypothetical protein